MITTEKALLKLIELQDSKIKELQYSDFKCVIEERDELRQKVDELTKELDYLRAREELGG